MLHMRALRLAFHASKQLPGTILTSRNSAAYARDRHCSLKRNKGHVSAHANMTSKSTSGSETSFKGSIFVIATLGVTTIAKQRPIFWGRSCTRNLPDITATTPDVTTMKIGLLP